MLNAYQILEVSILKLSTKLMSALSDYWLLKFGKPVLTRIDVGKMLAIPRVAAMNDPNNIFGIVHHVKSELLRLGASETTLNSYSRYGFAPILYFFSHFDESTYSSDSLKELVEEVRNCYELKEISIAFYQPMYRVATFIETYHSLGHLERRSFKRNGDLLYNLPVELEKLVQFFAERILNYRSWSPNTIVSCCSNIRGFLSCLEGGGTTEASGITRKAVNDGITQYAVGRGYGVKQSLGHIRIFLRLLFEEGALSDDLSEAMPELTPRRTVVRHSYSNEEIDRLLASTDKNTATGKRDYAIMLVAIKTGLRSVDIANLKFQNIDWRLNEIRIVQKKTGNALSLPLMPEVGNAIADYILTSRPECSTDHVFLTSTNAPQRIQRTTISAMARKYTTLAGICDEIYRRRGFHSFRRSYAVNLLESATPIDMLSELLGDVDINSVKPYLAIDETGLRDCAIDLDSIGTVGDSQ